MSKRNSHVPAATAMQCRNGRNRTAARSLLALGIAMALAGPAFGQDAAADAETTPKDLDKVVVTGVRGSVMRAQEIKQEADQIVDSVTAEDIGALPDRSVTETLKRVSGVTVTNIVARADADYLDSTLYTRAYFMNDRRYSLVVRARF